MAGSYGHVRPVPHGDDQHVGSWRLIENLGDAYECIEELLWLVLALAGNGASVAEADAHIEELLERVYYPMMRGEMPQDDYYRAAKVVMDSKIDLDVQAVRAVMRRSAEEAEKVAEEKIRAIVRDELGKAGKL